LHAKESEKVISCPGQDDVAAVAVVPTAFPTVGAAAQPGLRYSKVGVMALDHWGQRT